MTTSSNNTKISPLAVFRNRDFSFLWTAQLISTIGSSLTSLAASILIFRITGSALSVGLMLMATAAPSILVGLVAGVYVDRYNRKNIMIISDLLRGVLVILIPFTVSRLDGRSIAEVMPMGWGWLWAAAVNLDPLVILGGVAMCQKDEREKLVKPAKARITINSATTTETERGIRNCRT